MRGVFNRSSFFFNTLGYGFGSPNGDGIMYNKFRPFVRQRDLRLEVNGGVERVQFSSYGFLDTSLDRFWAFSLKGIHGEKQ